MVAFPTATEQRLADDVIRRVLSAFLLISILSAFVPLIPIYPQPWMEGFIYALNEAVAKRLVFGRDIIFTFGPFAAAYTYQYHPATDHLMLIANTLFGLAIATGSLSLAQKNRLVYVLFLPLAIALIQCHALGEPDALFFIIPVLFLMACVRMTLPETHKWKLPVTRLLAVSLLLLTLALSLLPLVKATFSVMCIATGGLGWLLLLRWRPGWACFLSAVFFVGLVGFWLFANQPLWALPRFFVTQIPIVTGYGDAMSVNGPGLDLIRIGIAAAFLVLAALLFFGHHAGLPGKALSVGLTLSFFVVFKAAFVRHDFHATIAADFVLLAAILFAMSLPHWAAATVIIASVAVWLQIVTHYFGPEYKNLIGALENSQTFGHLWDGLRVRLSGWEKLSQQFEVARAKIRQREPLPRSDSSVDIYPGFPSGQAILLANDLQWSPRPIMNSYSAYTPKLADMNSAHLASTLGARRIFFDVFPIDGRLATLEDGNSWPLLLTQYRFTGRTGRFLILDRNPGAIGVPELQNIFASKQRLGHEFFLPKEHEPIWAEIDLRLTPFGQILATLFKAPHLHILLRYEDGHTETFRYVAAMGRSGFIISPVIHDIADFAALAMSGRQQYFSAAWPKSVEIEADARIRLFWRHSFDVRLRRIEVPVQPGADKFVYDQFVNEQWTSDPAVNRKIVGSGECCIDAINRKTVSEAPIQLKGPLFVQGWAVVAGQKGIAADEVFVTLSSLDGNVLRVARARIFPRPDVNAYFKHPEMGAAGFEALLDSAELAGEYKLQIYVKRQNQLFSCPTTVSVRF
jgi:hypothetical protein